MSEPRTWRRKFQINLRVWLVVMAILAVIISWQSRSTVVTPGNVASLRKVATLDQDIWEIAWSPERDRMAVLGWEKPAEIRDSMTLKELEPVGDKLIHFAFSPDKHVVAYCKNDETAVILDRRTGTTIALDVGNPQPAMEFSPDGKTLATGGYGTRAGLWRVSDGELLRELNCGREGGLKVEFSPDGATLAVGNRNSVTRLFRVATGEQFAELTKPQSQGLRFSPDGKAIAVAYVDGTIALWDLNGRLIRERKTSAEELYQVAWSPDGKILASAGRKGKITLWTPTDLSILREIDGPEWVIGLSFSPDGRSLITAGGGQTVAAGRRSLTVWGIEGMLYTLTNRR